jgi:hypothetical protein
MHRSMSLRRVVDMILFALAFSFLLFTTLFVHSARPGAASLSMAGDDPVPTYNTK